MKLTTIHTLRCGAIAVVALTLQMCAPSVPQSAQSTGQQPKIEPDYTDLTIPVNIAPLNFAIDEKGDEYVTRFSTKGGAELVAGGKVLDIDVDKWHELLASAKGDTVYAEVYARQNGSWRKYAPIKYCVAEEIDPYISYRHIEPLYLNYETIRICQRCLENFDVSDIYSNNAYLNVEGKRQCVNCHSYQDYNKTGKMQMHIRVERPGTLIVNDGKVKKVNLKVGKAFSAGAYPSWHPTLPLIAYSINDTWQHFHSVDNNKVEVQDAASDIILYDTEKNLMKMVTETDTAFETFPYWSPDGKDLYYVGAPMPNMPKEELDKYRINNYKDVKYNLYKKRYNPETGEFGPTDSVFMASSIGKSATFPRIRPDGRFMVFTMGEYGTFHNFHHDADLYMMDMASGKWWPMDEINSEDTESYHSWSSNGKWMIFSSRRGGGSYTRFYLTHIDENGHASKPMILPQQSPFSDSMLFKSYNVPEFMAKPVEITRKQWIDAVDSDPVDANF